MFSTMEAALISEEWLSKCGFKWEQHDRQPSRHWRLWLGSAIMKPGNDFTLDPDSLGIEIAKSPPLSDHRDVYWNCWIRNDIAGRYSRIIHVRYIHLQIEVEKLIESLIGYKLEWENVFFGGLRMPLHADRLREEQKRFDISINHDWAERCDRENGIVGIDKHKVGIVK